MKCTYPTLQDGNALLCHSCELRLTNIKKAETKISDMKGIVRDQLATLCNPEKRSIAAECDPPVVPQAKRLKLTGEVEQRDTAGGGASSPQLELGNEDRLKAQLLWSHCINTHGSPGPNIPCDLHMEHLNKRLKTIIRNMRGNVNPTTIHKAGKSIAPVQRICEIFEAQGAKKHSSFHHIMPEFGKDLKIF